LAKHERADSHSHCPICMKVVPEGTYFCSTECEERFKNDMSERKRKWYLSLIPFIVFTATSALTIYMFLTLVLLRV